MNDLGFRGGESRKSSSVVPVKNDRTNPTIDLSELQRLEATLTIHGIRNRTVEFTVPLSKLLPILEDWGLFD